MSFLREEDLINFQKASCALDGCVKIYTSCVDSMATVTTKLLGELATSAKRAPREKKMRLRMMIRIKRIMTNPSRRRSGNTLTRDFSQLTLEKFIVESLVNPLFEKTSADSDEGGARGLLFHHLNVDAEGKIIFGAGDARDKGNEDDDDDDDEEDQQEEQEDEVDTDSQRRKKTKKNTDVEAAMIDIQRLQSKFLPSLNQIFEKDICPSLRDFQLTGSSEMGFSFLRRFQGDDDEAENSNQRDDDDDEYEIGINPGNAFDEDFGGGDFNAYDDDGDAMEGVEGQEGIDRDAHGQQGHAEAPLVVEDAFGDLDEQIAAHRAGPDLDLMMETDVIMDKTSTDRYQYFDAALMRNWAGPEILEAETNPQR
ncbi:condensin complex subunit 2 [Entomortierella parvispora]|uniref:Condensin complex subunit 2 n=1 Tax=Entomortierella parvispora TaxID=205924 RepID=A0A9P3LRI2_9FUNG|nr:condensin complex subunit 2 [Entomortierella parvispora]